jgi:hypothetical protein
MRELNEERWLAALFGFFSLIHPEEL